MPGPARSVPESGGGLRCSAVTAEECFAACGEPLVAGAEGEDGPALEDVFPQQVAELLVEPEKYLAADEESATVQDEQLLSAAVTKVHMIGVAAVQVQP